MIKKQKYNKWVSDETIEDYSLRYTPKSFRKWPELLIANTAIGGISFLALEAIGASIAIHYGFSTAFWAILTASLIIFFTAIPISYYAARYNIDIDLITRSTGFGYVGSTITSLIYASFCFIFFALEAAIMAQALELYFGLPLGWGYLLSSIIIIPIVFYGMTLISKLQLWTQPIWIIMMIAPFVAVLYKEPEAINAFVNFAGSATQNNEFDFYYFGFAIGISLSLIGQIGEQVDYLRFMPPLHEKNKFRWWSSMLIGGPGWIIIGFLKQMGGIFLAALVLLSGLSLYEAKTPIQMYYVGYQYIFENPAIALAASTFFVIVSQIKINVTNAYAGSLAWSNFFSRMTHSHPGRVVWMVFNIFIALVLMEMGVFDMLEKVLGLYSNVAIAWIAVISADLLINKPLGLSPKIAEFKRAYLYNVNPVGIGSMGIASVVSILAFVGVFGNWAQSYSSIIALVLAFILSPVIAILTKGKYYIARENTFNFSTEPIHTCASCDTEYEVEDIAYCPVYDIKICSLCCSIESLCRDKCKTKEEHSRREELGLTVSSLFFKKISLKTALKIFDFTWILGLILSTVSVIAWMIYSTKADTLSLSDLLILKESLIQFVLVISIFMSLFVWWILLLQETNVLAEEEIENKNNLLSKSKENLEYMIEEKTLDLNIKNLQLEGLLKVFDERIISSKSDLRGNITAASQAFSDISGYSIEELIGKPHSTVRHPDMPVKLFEELWATIKAGKVWTGEVKNLKKDGGFYWVDVVIEPEFNSTREIIGYNAVRTDITAKKELEVFSENLELKVIERTEKIEEQQQRFTSMVSNVPGVIYRQLIDENMTILYSSDNLEQLSGYPVEDFTVNHSRSFKDIAHPDDYDATLKTLEEQLEKGNNFIGDYRIIHANGEIRWVRDQGQITYPEDGSEPWIDGALFDTTEAKKAEEKLELLSELVHGSLKSASVGVWWIDFTEEDIFHALQTTSDMIGVKFIDKDHDALVLSEWEAVIKKAGELLPEYKKEIDDTIESFHGAITGKYDSYHAVYPLVNDDGKIRWIEDRADVPKRDKSGNALLMTGTVIDITDMKEAKGEVERIHKHTRDSIEYASLIQSALIPDNNVFKDYFSDYFNIWHPKDIVGGDIYLFEELRDKDECLLMVIDCTGHGVPGAFVTMLVKAIERQVISKIENDENIDVSPAWILSYFNKTMKKLLQQESEESISNAGFDGGIIYYNKKENIIKFAGAETPLFYIEDEELKSIKGNRHSIGYKKSDASYEFKEHVIPVKEGMKFYLSTDGYFDQNGGAKVFPMGKKQFTKLIVENQYETFADQQEMLLHALGQYQGNEERNDDVTVVGFEIKKQKTLKTILEYNGVLTQGIIAHSMDVLENSIEDMNAIGKISTIVVELTQNMMHYSKSKDLDSREILPAGLIEVTQDAESTYYVKSENVVSIEDKTRMETKFTEIQSLDASEVKKRYRERRKSGADSHEKGGGIGFYEIAKLTQEFEYSFKEINAEKFTYEFKAIVSTKKKAKATNEEEEK